jgi:DNA-binding NarL/FixJ family response regulator
MVPGRSTQGQMFMCSLCPMAGPRSSGLPLEADRSGGGLSLQSSHRTCHDSSRALGDPFPEELVRVVIADDSALIRRGVAGLLEEAGYEVIGEAETADEVLTLIRADPPDVAILDIRMPPTYTDEGLRAARTVREENPEVGVLVLSQYVETDYAMEVIAEGSGGVGYLLKDRVVGQGDLAEAVRRVGTGGSVIDPEVVSTLMQRRRRADPLAELTDRERDVLALMAEGRSNLAIGQAAHLAPKTVEAHVRRILTKLGLEPTPDDNRRVLAVLTYLRA